MKILFVTNELSYADHIAIAYLSAVAKQLGHSTFFCTLEKEAFCRTDLTTAVAQVRPNVVAYSVNVIGFQKTVAAHQKATKVHDFISIMGGPHATYSPETFSKSGMDAYCVGEGEAAFRDFLIRVEDGESFDDIENLITKNQSNAVRSLIRNLDELPPLDRDLVLSNSLLKDVPKKTFYASRGCPFKCAYCCNSYYHKLYKGKGRFVRRHSVERILEEIEHVKMNYRTEFIKFGDDCFAIKADEWLEEFAVKYSRRIGVPFNCYLRVDTIDDALLRLLKKAGCFSVHLSVDSTSQLVREQVLRRSMRSENVAERLRLVRAYGINTWVNYMLAAPESTLQDDLDTIRLSREGQVTYPSYSTTVPMKGTDLHEYCLQRGLIDPSFEGDMSECSEKSVLGCFPEQEKNTRYNIYLLGALIAKLPYPLDQAALSLIKLTPPNFFYKMIHNVMYKYYIENKIFQLT